MNSSRKAFAKKVFFRALIFAVIPFAFATAHAQQLVAKPQPILIAEWSDSDRTDAEKLLQLRAANRAATTENVDKSAVSAARSTVSAAVVAHAKSPAKFAYLEPTALEQKAFDLINEKRRLVNLPALEWDLGMLYVAREHSGNMARLNFFAHKGMDGKTADDRAHNVGIRDWSFIGENIAFNQGAKNTVEFAVECWMNSTGHKNNLLDKKWSRSGIGIAVTPEGKFYITQVFRN